MTRNGTRKRRMRTPKTRSLTIGPTTSVATILLLLVGVTASPALAEQFESSFDGPSISWKVRCRDSETTLRVHERRRDAGHRGGAEFVGLNSLQDNVSVHIEHQIPVAQVLDELEARVWIHSDRPGAVLALRIGFRGLVDTKTGVPLTMIVSGDAYQSAGKWQQLTCRTSEKNINNQLRILRANNRISIDPATMYVDRVVLRCNLSSGGTQILLDDLGVGPIVSPLFVTDSNATVTQTTATIDEPTKSVPVEFQLKKLRVQGEPFLPRIIRDSGTIPGVLAAAGFNVAWVSDPDANTVTGPLRREGLWLTATPPFAKDTSGDPLDSEDASLLPFARNTEPIIFWMMGTRLTAMDRPKLPSWSNQVRDADRTFKRPLAADVADDEKFCSRHLDLLGISRHVLNSETTLIEYREWIAQKRERAWPGTLCWTWIQTEPTPEILSLTGSSGIVPMIEPEQIRMQVYAALAAGCRGLGYWTTTRLDAEGSAARERLLALTQINLELSLFEPWLATGSSVQIIPMTVDSRVDVAATTPKNSLGMMPKNPLGLKTAHKKSATSDTNQSTKRELSAALIRSELGVLLLPMWIEDQSQFVPGKMTANNVTIVVPGGGETVAAWEVSTTKRLQNLPRETVAGGVKIVLPRLDQTTAILLTSDQANIERLNQRIAAIQDRSAAAILELGRLKLERVRETDLQLQKLGVGLPEAKQLLEKAQSCSEKANDAFKQQQYHASQTYALDVMQFTRMLQRAHWDNAVKNLASPITSPYTVCFQTLPAHWRFIRGVTESRESVAENKLPSGEFEDLDTLIAAGWRHEQQAIPGLHSVAELHPSAKQGQYSLRIATQQTSSEQQPPCLGKIPISVISPPLPTHAGQVVKISGWTKLTHPVERSIDGVTIHDSLMGKTGAWRVRVAREWQRFELLRVVSESQDMTVTISLHGLGELSIDDLQIVTFNPSYEMTESLIPMESAVKPARFLPLEALDIKRLNPLSKRK